MAYERMVDEQSSPNKGFSGLGEGHEARKFEMCLSEAVKGVDQDFLGRAQSISLMRDARKSRLNV